MAYSKSFLKSRTHAERREISREAGMLSSSEPVRTGHQIFDREVNHPDRGYIGVGNVSSDTQRSAYIRPRSQTVSNGMEFEPGELRDSDLKQFRSNMPANMRDRILALTEDEPIILYEFSHKNRNANRVIHGWIMTDEYHRQIETAALRQGSLGIMYHVGKHISWSDRMLSDPSPTEDLLKISEGATVEDIRALALLKGYAIATTREECQELGMQFSQDDPILAVRNIGDNIWIRSADPAEMMTMIAIRENMTPNDLDHWRRMESPWNGEAVWEIVNTLDESDIRTILADSEFELTGSDSEGWNIVDVSDDYLPVEVNMKTPADAFFKWTERYHMGADEIRRNIEMTGPEM